MTKASDANDKNSDTKDASSVSRDRSDTPVSGLRPAPRASDGLRTETGAEGEPRKKRSSSRRIRFEELADQLAERLEAVGTPEAIKAARGGRELAETFRSWGGQPPSDAERLAAIAQVTEFNRRALEIITRRKR